MVTGSNDVDEIYHRMAVIRREHHTNVRESVAGAEAVVDWGRYTWTYPWVASGAAAAVGYLIYTSCHQKVTADTASLADGARASESVAGATAKGLERSMDRPESPARRLGHLVSRGHPCGPELPAAMARTTILDEDGEPNPSHAVGRRAGRLDGTRKAVVLESGQRLRSKPGFWRPGQ